MTEPEYLEFNVETQCTPVPIEVIELARMLKDDPEATLRERQLAWIVLKLAKSVNKLVCDLDHGSAVVRVYEKDIHRERR